MMPLRLLLIFSSVMTVRAVNNTTMLTTTTSTTLMIKMTNSSSIQCQNGGLIYAGICICSDNYNGTFCETSNFCPSKTVNDFTFPQTISGQAGYSNETCPQGTPNAGLHRATSFCEKGSFSLPTVLKCDLTLDTIDKDLSAASDTFKQSLAFSTQILTSKPEKLTSQNISSAAKIASRLLSLTETSQDIKVAALTTVSQLLEARQELFSSSTDDSTTRLTKTLTKFSLERNDKEPLRVQPNIAIYSARLKDNSDIKMTVFPDPVHSGRDPLSLNRIKFNVNSLSKNIPVDVNINFKFQKDSSPNLQNENNDIGIVLYNNDQFFKSKVFKVSLDTNRKVISGTQMNENIESVHFTMSSEMSSSKYLHDFACVTWDYTEHEWSTKGCTKSENMTCNCKGTPNVANFAMLMSFGSDYEYSLALSMISKIGCALSVAGLAVTAVFQILTRKSRKANPTILMVSVSVCLTIVYLIFIFGINNPNMQSKPVIGSQQQENDIPLSDFYERPDQGPCTAVTVLLHYFLLATFTWSTLYGTYIFILIKNAPAGSPRYYGIFSTITGWGLPAVVALSTFGTTYRTEMPSNYRREEFCWLAAVDHNNKFDIRKPMLWGFLLPIAVMVTVNMGTFFHFALSTFRTNPALNNSNVPTLHKKMITCISMSVVLGLSWISGYLMLLTTSLTTHKILSFIFCICSTTQGIQIFVFFTLRTTFFKEKAQALLKLIPTPVFALHRKSFDLWATTESGSYENYRSVHFDSREMPARDLN